ncbi:MAG TPA: tyrosine-type recombinase/integrase [Dehalococcoidia bacterium]|nr:tyrosine-type recombinase/integrase [Dehalococcoidia bacterium]
MPGSLFKHKRSGRWTVKLHIGNGRYQQRYFATRAEAEAYQASLASHPLHAANVGIFGTARERLREHIERWLRRQEARVKAGTLEVKTLHEYRGHLRRHVLPDLGWMPVAKVSPRVLEEQYARLLDRGLSPTTVRHVAMLLHKIFADAVKQETVRQNPCAHVEPPARRRKEMRVWDFEQARLFLAEAKRSSRHSRLYLMLIVSGMRPSEALGLRRQHVSLLLGTASVQQKLYRVNKQLVIGQPKTDKSRRAVALPPLLVEELRAMFAEQDAERARRLECPSGVGCRTVGCRSWHDYGLAFAQPNGRPLHENNIAGHDFPRVIRRAGLPRIRLYDLRHLCASLLAPYAPLKVISEHLGHSSVAVTGDIYSHLLPGAQEGAVRALEARLFSTPGLHLDSTLQRGYEATPGTRENPHPVGVSAWLGEEDSNPH